MSTQKRRKQANTIQKAIQKAEEHEDFVDHLLDNGDRIEEENRIKETSYEELTAYDKFQLLTDFYNRNRDIDKTRSVYDAPELVEYAASIQETPEAVNSSYEDEKELNQEHIFPSPEVEAETLDQSRTGRYPSEPPQERKKMELSTGTEGEWIRATRILDAK